MMASKYGLDWGRKRMAKITIDDIAKKVNVSNSTVSSI